MKKRKSNRIAALFASGLMFCGGIFASCSFLEPELSDYDKNALAVGIYLQQQEKLKAANSNSSSSASGTTYETLTESRVSSTAPDTAGTITVSGAASYSGTSISEAWAAAAAVTSSGSTVLIEIPAGTYDLGTDQLAYNGSATIEIKGTGSDEYGSDVLIKTALKDLSSEQSRSTISFKGSGNLVLENIRFENTYAQTASGDAQLEIIGYDGTGYVAGYNCCFISGQDTMRTTGKAWFYHCYIEGDVDFLWMEQAGKVALYEDCRIRAISGRSDSAYFAAPRVTVSNGASYYKGLVIYNSKLEVEDGIKKVYLGRTPWGNSSTIYNDVSIVGCKLYGYLTDVWKNEGMSNSDIIFSGFNTDSYFPSNSNGSVYDSTTISNEFAGRNNILNRMYSGDFGIIYKADEIWDINSLASDKSWDVSADSSTYLLSGEKDCNTYTYNWVNGSNGTFTTDDGNVTVTTSNNNNGSHGVNLSTNDTITVKMATAGKITIYGCAYGTGTMSVKEGNTDAGTITTRVSTDGDGVDYIYATDAEATITFTATASCYIHGLKITEFPVFVQAKSLEITGSTTSIVERQPLQLSVSYTPANTTLKTIEWSSSNTSVASVSDSGLVVGLSAGSTTITAAIQDGSGVTATYPITVSENTLTPSAADITYSLTGGVGNPYYSDDTFLQVSGKGDNGGHGIIVVNGSTATLMVAKACTVTLGTCAYDNACTITVTDSSNNTVATITHSAGDGSNDSTTETVSYSDTSATTLTFTWSGATSDSSQMYVHYIKVSY